MKSKIDFLPTFSVKNCMSMSNEMIMNEVKKMNVRFFTEGLYNGYECQWLEYDSDPDETGFDRDTVDIDLSFMEKESYQKWEKEVIARMLDLKNWPESRKNLVRNMIINMYKDRLELVLLELWMQDDENTLESFLQNYKMMLKTCSFTEYFDRHVKDFEGEFKKFEETYLQ